MRKVKLSLRHNKVLRKKVKKNREDRRIKEVKEKGFIRNRNKGSYVSGMFWSSKNNREYIFRSTYEFAYFYILEQTDDVMSYIVEPFHLPYKHPFNGKIRKYYPDIMVLYRDGTMKLLEIKPASMVTDPVVARKASAARAHLLRNNIPATFEFITEEDIFNTAKDYRNLKDLLLAEPDYVF